MGRITIFALPSCRHCKKVKGLFNDKQWPFYDIDVQGYPEKRNDMMKMTDQLTVPQIFFNDRFVGGASEVEQLEQRGELASLYQEMLKAPDPTAPELQRPDRAPDEEKKPLPRTDLEIDMGTTRVKYTEVVRTLADSLDMRNRAYCLVYSHHKSFSGKNVVDVLSAKFGSGNGREAAVSTATALLAAGTIRQLSGAAGMQDSEAALYQLSMDSKGFVLNGLRSWSDRVDDGFVSLQAARKQFSALQDSFSDGDGMVDYIALVKDIRYTEFQEAVCELQKIEITTMSHDAKLAFFINLYNLFVLHAFAEVGIPRSNWQRLKFFDDVKYNVGGYELSLNQIENGILRMNRKAPFHLSASLSAATAAALSLKTAEPRIHFALNCGAKSCPPIKNFSAQTVHEELRIAATAFLSMADNFQVTNDAEQVSVTKILSWYRGDFGSTDLEVAHTLLPYLRGANKDAVEKAIGRGQLKLTYNFYDWSTNAGTSKAYGS